MLGSAHFPLAPPPHLNLHHHPSQLSLHPLISPCLPLLPFSNPCSTSPLKNKHQMTSFFQLEHFWVLPRKREIRFAFYHDLQGLCLPLSSLCIALPLLVTIQIQWFPFSFLDHSQPYQSRDLAHVTSVQASPCLLCKGGFSHHLRPRFKCPLSREALLTTPAHRSMLGFLYQPAFVSPIYPSD